MEVGTGEEGVEKGGGGDHLPLTAGLRVGGDHLPLTAGGVVGRPSTTYSREVSRCKDDKRRAKQVRGTCGLAGLRVVGRPSTT